MSDQMQDQQAPCGETIEGQLDQVAGGLGELTLKMCPKCGHIMVKTTSEKSGDCLMSLDMYVYRCRNSSCNYEEPCLASEDLGISHDSDKLF